MYGEYYVQFRGLAVAWLLATGVRAQSPPPNVTSTFTDNCYTPRCMEGTWTAGPGCTLYTQVPPLISSLQNPPPEATATFTATDFCTSQIASGVTVSIIVYTHEVTTTTKWHTTYNVRTTTLTDESHPTATSLCPRPASSAQCGWDPKYPGDDGFVDRPTDDQVLDPEHCHQSCLARPGSCRAYRVERSWNHWRCRLYSEPLDDEWKSSRRATPGGSIWYERDCTQHAPTACRSGVVSTTSSVATPPAVTMPPASLTTPAPGVAPDASPPARRAPDEPRREAMDLAKRDDQELPNWLDINSSSSYFYLPIACTCIISSLSVSTTRTRTRTGPLHTRFYSTVSRTSTLTGNVVYNETAGMTTYIPRSCENTFTSLPC